MISFLNLLEIFLNELKKFKLITGLITKKRYEKDKEKIMGLVNKSVDMCVNHYSDKLSIKSKKPEATCKDIKIKQRGKVEEMALKYLNNEYTYDVK